MWFSLFCYLTGLARIQILKKQKLLKAFGQNQSLIRTRIPSDFSTADSYSSKGYCLQLTAIIIYIVSFTIELTH